MTRLPEPEPRQPHATQAGQPALPEVDQKRIDRIAKAFSVALDEADEVPTSYKDPRDLPAIGDTPPVLQPETRRVPTWATGIAVGSIGAGAGFTGLGCGAWLVFKGLSMVSVPSLQTFALVLMAPFAGAALAALAIGAAVAKAKRSSTTNVYKGDVLIKNNTEVHSSAHGMFARNRNELPSGSGQ